jgi:hypothetical protein
MLLPGRDKPATLLRRMSSMAEYTTPEMQTRTNQNEGAPEPIYPWDISPELEAKIVAHTEADQYESFSCKCNEALNSLLRNFAFKGLKDNEAELRIYPDGAAVT